MKSTNLLIQEHKLILRALDVLDAMSAACEQKSDFEQADIYGILDFLRWFADGHHQAKEETILFPALKKAAASQVRPVDHMIHEHDQERSSVEELEKDARLADVSRFVACANRLTSTLRNHIYKEDRILFETADSLLNAQEDEAVFDQLNRFETPLDKEGIEKRIEDLRALEWKYLRK
jgi:hemerythrin-like domain-containing protein